MEARLILFDVDGTLIDAAGAGRRAMEHAFQEVFGIDGIASRAVGVPFAGRTDPLILESIASALGLERLRFASQRREIEHRYLLALGAEMARPDARRRVLPGVRELLDALRERRDRFVHLGLVTGNLEPGARTKLEPFGLNAYFPGGGFSSDHTDRREIARLAREKISALAATEFRAASVFVIGDTEHDVDCARANGFQAIAVHSGWVPRGVLERSRPDVLLDSLADTAGVLAALGLD